MRVSEIWRDAKKERPKKSGDYVVIPLIDTKFVMTVSYSKKYDAFNVDDLSDDLENKMDVVYWTTFQELGIFQELGMKE